MIKRLILDEFGKDLCTNVLTIECTTLHQMKSLLKVLDLFGFKWNGGQSLLHNVEHEFEIASRRTFNHSAYIGLMFFGWLNKDLECMGYRTDVESANERERVKAVPYKYAIEKLKNVKRRRNCHEE